MVVSDPTALRYYFGSRGQDRPQDDPPLSPDPSWSDACTGDGSPWFGPKTTHHRKAFSTYPVPSCDSFNKITPHPGSNRSKLKRVRSFLTFLHSHIQTLQFPRASEKPTHRGARFANGRGQVLGGHSSSRVREVRSNGGPPSSNDQNVGVLGSVTSSMIF